MLIFELCKIAGLTLSLSRSSNTFTLALDMTYCSLMFKFCALNSVVCLSSRKCISVSISAILSFSFNAFSLFTDFESGDDTLECLLDLSNDTFTDTRHLFDFASMVASLFLSKSLIQPWIICLNSSMLVSIL